jgi:hypothetical protein
MSVPFAAAPGAAVITGRDAGLPSGFSRYGGLCVSTVIVCGARCRRTATGCTATGSHLCGTPVG